MLKRTHEPRILGFLCNWCSYAGADLAGVSRFQYPTNLRIIRVMCSGRVDPILILEAFIKGLDAVMVLGCHPGDCHYITGNYYTENRMRTLQRFLKILGIKSERLLLDWVSASEGERFATLVKDFTQKIMKIGPINNDVPFDQLRIQLMAAREAFSQNRMRWLVNKERTLLEEGNVFGEKVDQNEYNTIKFDALVREYEKNRILYTIREKGLSVKEIAQTIKMSAREVLKNLIIMEQDGEVIVSEIEGVHPKYRKLGA